MFVIMATKPLMDGTKGYRFNLFGVKGLTRKRKVISRGYKVVMGDCMIAYHLGKRSFYVEADRNTYCSRMLRHFAG
jgi:hypothetical protein